MARRKNPKQPTPIGRGDRGPVLLGDVRETPVEVREDNRTYKPVIALWVRADDGYVVGQLLDEPGHPAQTLVNALRSPTPVPGEPQPPVLPSRVVLFNQELARQVAPMLAPLNIEVTTSPPFEPFEEMFDELFAHLQQPGPFLDLPEDVLRPLLAAAGRLWRAKPWSYAFDYPPFSIVPGQGNVKPLFASIFGANEEVFGVALYSSSEDYEATLELGESATGPRPEAMSPEALDKSAAKVLEVIHHRAFLVSFEPRDDLPSGYLDQLTQGGWSRRMSVAPIFSAMGGGQEPALLTPEEAAEVTLAIDSLVTFCDRHRKRIADEQFPIRDTVEVSLGGKAVPVDVSVPAEEPSAPPAARRPRRRGV